MDEKRFNVDHFYNTFPKNYFDSLKQLPEICKNVKYIQTSGLNTHVLDGVYITTKDGHYIELLNKEVIEGNVNRNLIAVNTFTSPLKDESTLHELIGEKLNWKRTPQPTKIPNNGNYAIEDVGKDWFYVWFVENKIALEENTGIWIIDYQDQKFNRASNTKKLEKDYDFKQVLNVKWSLNSKGFEIMKSFGKWSATKYKIVGDSLLLFFNNPNGKEVKFEFIKNDNRKQGFEEITLEKIEKGKEFNLIDSSFIELIDEKDTVTIKFNEY